MLARRDSLGRGWTVALLAACATVASISGVAGVPVDCGEEVIDDGNPCTVDSCDRRTGVHHIPGNAGTECRAAVGDCDQAETCDGKNADCPAEDAMQSSGTVCDDGNACTTEDTCDGFGGCVGGAPPPCDDSDACTDDVCDSEDGCLFTSNDTDGDRVCPADNCPEVPNADQLDGDEDGAGDACDVCSSDAANDADADGYCANEDNCPTIHNPDQDDNDKDRVGDACTTDRVNFGPPESEVPAGFVLDDGSPFDPSRGFGWQGTVATRERGVEGVAQERDTFAFSREARRWTGELRNGVYDLLVECGDPRYAQGPHRVRANDVTVVDDLETRPETFVQGSSRVTVRNGRLELVIGGTDGNTMINWFELTPVAEAPSFLRSIDFQSYESEPAVGFEPDYGDPYDEETGYGWSDSLEGVTRESAAPRVLDSFVHVPYFASWDIAVPEPGYYEVWLAVGDASFAAGPHRVAIEGQPVVLSEPTSAGVFLERHAGAFVDDGYLTLDVGIEDEEESFLGEFEGGTDLSYVVVASAPEDADGDEIPNEEDLCPFAADPDQDDEDRDEVGDACDPDRDDDGVENPADICPGAYDPSQEDSDLDGRGDACDVCPLDAFDDSDGDGICGIADNCPDVANPGQEDSDSDGLGDACAELRINFCPVGSESVEGFQADHGRRFDPFLGRGWDGSLPSRDRSTSAAPELDTFVFSSAVRTWRAELPNGVYQVRASIGDATYPQGPQQVVVQGTTVFTDAHIDAGDFQTGEVVVGVRNGRLELEIGYPEITSSALPAGSGRSGRLVLPSSQMTEAVDDARIDGLGAPSGFTTLNWVEALYLGAPAGLFRSFNFQPASSERPHGAEVDAGETYTALRGFGWSAPVPTRDRQSRVPQNLDTFAFTSAPRTWSVDLPNGAYRVFLSVGDARYTQGPQRVVVEGSPIIDGESTAAGAFLEPDAVVLVEDGQLTLEVGGAGGNTCLNYVTIESVLD